jgi:hypothetical protein
VDILSDRTDGGGQLFVQSKLTIEKKDEIDTIVIKFEAFEIERFRTPAQSALFEVEPDGVRPTFAIVCASKIDGVVRRYIGSALRERSERWLLHRLSKPQNAPVLPGYP